MRETISRRRALATLGVTSATLAGCTEYLPNETSEITGEEPNENTVNGSDSNGESTAESSDVRWPAIDTGEGLSDFENLDRWEARTGHIEAAPDEARTGSQAAVLKSDGENAEMRRFFPEGLDLEGWDTSVAIKAEEVSRVVVEFIAPTRDQRLTTVRPIPDEFDGWFRLDCGYEHKPEGEPVLSDVSQLNIVAVGPEGGPTRIVVDDLRRTEAVDNGKAILAFYGGHDSHYEIAAELLEERGWAGAVPVDPGRVGGEGRVDFPELRQLRDRGWDVCSYPRSERDITEQPEDRQRTVIGTARNSLADHGFPDGARHFFAPDWRRMDDTTHTIVRELHESGFLFGSCPAGAPPTGMHMTPVIWGPALRNGVRRHINLCDQYRQLTVIRIPPILDEEDVEGDAMSLDDFEHLLDHIEHRGLDVITPSDLVDGIEESDDSDGEAENESRPEGQILESGHTHRFEGAVSGETEPFDLSEGILTASHESDGELVVELQAIDGKVPNERLVTSANGDSGESILVVSDGTYKLEVDTDGPWSVSLEQPEVHSDDLEDPPLETSGEGSGFIGPLWAEGGLSLDVTHDGEGPFIVDGYGVDGSWEQLVNQTGPFDNSRSYAASGVCWINVEADGNWTIDIVTNE
ncbi:polysaccharide deacetylase family protein [Natrialbaceae archaeon A-CW2]